jgi:hypothetical protein
MYTTLLPNEGRGKKGAREGQQRKKEKKGEVKRKKGIKIKGNEGRIQLPREGIAIEGSARTVIRGHPAKKKKEKISHMNRLSGESRSSILSPLTSRFPCFHCSSFSLFFPFISALITTT